MFEEAVHQIGVHAKSGHLNPGSAGPPHVTFSLTEVTLESAVVFGHFFLGIDVFHLVCCVPPLITSLHVNVIRLQFLNKFLGALGEHRTLIACANKVDILSIETFSQMNQSRLEACFSVTNTVTNIALEVSTAFEDVSRE